MRVTVTPNYDRWMRGFAHLPQEAALAGRHKWEGATRQFFDATQSVVHVDTGALKASGTWDVIARGGELTGKVEYDAEYAEYENARGGPHAFMNRGWEQTESTFRAAMLGVWTEVVTKWK
jgi:hypothetical protein